MTRPAWLEKWSRQFKTSEGIAQAVTYAGYAMVGALVLFVIWSELRAAGLLGGTRRARGAPNPAAQWRRRLMLADVAAAPLADRPGMLLRLLGEALTRARSPAGRRRPDGRAPSCGAPISIRNEEREELDACRRHRRRGALRRQPAARRGARRRGGGGAKRCSQRFARLRGQTLMRERGITFLLALAALAAFYGLWLRPAPVARSGCATPRGRPRRSGAATVMPGLFEWLQRSGVRRALVPRAVHRVAAARRAVARQSHGVVAARGGGVSQR